MYIIYGQGHACRCPGSLCRQDISRHGLDLIYKVYSELIMRRVLSTMKTELYAWMKEDKNGRYYVNRGLSSSNSHTGRYFRCLGFGLTQWLQLNISLNNQKRFTIYIKEIYSVVFLSGLIYKLSMLCLRRILVWYHHALWDHRHQWVRRPSKLLRSLAWNVFFFKCINRSSIQET